MFITLTISDITMAMPIPRRMNDSARFDTFSFEVRVVPDPKATSWITEPPEFEDPFVPPAALGSLELVGHCEVIRRRPAK